MFPLSKCRALAGLALCTSLLAACSSPPAAAPVPMPALTPGTRPVPAPAAPAAPVATDSTRMLAAYEWSLARSFDAQGRPDAQWHLAGRAPLRLVFQADRLTVQNLCNVVGAAYSVQGTEIKVGPGMSTQMSCPEPGLMQLEQRVTQRLPRAQRFEQRVSDTQVQLVLHFADGSRWELAGAPTPATRYGSTGERIFLEVAPQRVNCHHPLMPRARCLRVRDVRYDEQGRKLGTGEWRIHPGEIEGYQHRAGVRNVLRLQRYSLARNGQLPADGPSHAYVLDMVVETERMR